MAQAKRSRPAFSPPRPKASKTNGVAKSKAANGRGVRGRPSLQEKANKTSKKRAASPTPSASDAENESEGDEENEDQSQEDTSEIDLERGEDEGQSPEPDFMLAEVIHEWEQPGRDAAVPLPLLHRIIQHHFHDQDSTRLSTDAREVVGRYVEIFVKEAIMRASFERQDGGEDGGMGSNRVAGGDGWLEVEDLEKVSAQLCLDF